MAFAGKNRYEETKSNKISRELNEDINDFLKSFSTIIKTDSIKNDIRKTAENENKDIEDALKKKEELINKSGISAESEIKSKSAEYLEKIKKAEALRSSIDGYNEQIKSEKDVLKIVDLATKIKTATKDLDTLKPEEEDAKKCLELFDKIDKINKQLGHLKPNHDFLVSLIDDPFTALRTLILSGVDSTAKELKFEFGTIRTEDEALRLIANNKRFNSAISLSDGFAEFLDAMSKDQDLARIQGKKMNAELATTYRERVRGRVGPYLGRKSSADISEKRISNMEDIVNDIINNPEVLKAVGEAYLTVSIFGDLNRKARSMVKSGKIKTELEPNLKTLKEYLASFDYNVDIIKSKISPKLTAESPNDSNDETAKTNVTGERVKKRSSSTKTTYYGWNSKASMNIWLNELDNYLHANPKQKDIIKEEYEKYSTEIKNRTLTMEHALQLYTAVISAKTEVLKGERGGETHFNHATKHLISMFNSEPDLDKRKEIADMLYRVDLAYTASISSWRQGERESNKNLITLFELTNSIVQLMYPDANTQPEYERVRKELQKISEIHANQMYKLLRGRTLQIPTNTSNITDLIRKPK